MPSQLVPRDKQCPELVSCCGNSDDFLALRVVKQPTGDFSTITLTHEERIEHCLSAMLHASNRASSLDLERHWGCGLPDVRSSTGEWGARVGHVLHDGFDRCVNLPFEPVGWGPDVFFDVVQL